MKVADLDLTIGFTTQSLKGVSLERLLKNALDFKIVGNKLNLEVDLFNMSDRNDKGKEGTDYGDPDENIPASARRTNERIQLIPPENQENMWVDAWQYKQLSERRCKDNFDGIRFLGQTCWNHYYWANVYQAGHGGIAGRIFPGISGNPTSTRNNGAMMKVTPNAIYAMLVKQTPGKIYIYDRHTFKEIWRGSFDTAAVSGFTTGEKPEHINQRKQLVGQYVEVNFNLISSQPYKQNMLAMVGYGNAFFAYESNHSINELRSDPTNRVNNGAETILARIMANQTGATRVAFADLVANGIKENNSTGFFQDQTNPDFYCVNYQGMVRDNAGNENSVDLSAVADIGTNKLIGAVRLGLFDQIRCNSVEDWVNLSDPKVNSECQESIHFDELCGVSFMYDQPNVPIIFGSGNSMKMRLSPDIIGPLNHEQYPLDYEGVMKYVAQLDEIAKTRIIKAWTGLAKSSPESLGVNITGIKLVEANFGQRTAVGMLYEGDDVERVRLHDLDIICDDPRTVNLLDLPLVDLESQWSKDPKNRWPKNNNEFPAIGALGWAKELLNVMVNKNYINAGFSADPRGVMEINNMRCNADYVY